MKIHCIHLCMLLWKNVKLRRSKKIRTLAELIWPLFLFLILVWVKFSRDLTKREPNCYHAERPLPSSGLLPFLRTFVCELNYSCYARPINHNYDKLSLTNLFNISTNLTIAIAPLASLTSLLANVNLTNDLNVAFYRQREIATNITRKITLRQDIINIENFTNTFIPFISNDTLTRILNSSLNFNLLYSNYSQNVTNGVLPIPSTFSSIINSLYGEDLDNLQPRKNTVDNIIWINEHLCVQSLNKTQKLFRHPKLYDEDILSFQLCNNSNLVRIVTYLSENINFTRVREMVLLNSSFEALTQQTQVSNVSFAQLQEGLSLLQDVLNNLRNNTQFVNISTNSTDLGKMICGDSALNIFRLINSRTTTTTTTASNSSTNSTSSQASNLTSLIYFANRISNLSRLQCETTLKFKYPHGKKKSCLCEYLYFQVANPRAPQSLQLIWKQFKPQLLGKLLFAPNTSFVQEIVKKANVTFETIDSLSRTFLDLSKIPNGLSELNRSLSNLSSSLQLLNISMENVPSLDLTNLTVPLEFLGQIALFVSNMINCVELDRFQGFNTEWEAVDKGMEMIYNESFWSAFIFNVDNSKKISYKIRFNTSYTHNTFYYKSRQYLYGPNNCIFCNSDFLYGYIYLQDMLEKAIIEVKTGTQQDLGITTHMTPYPCHVNDRFVRAISALLPLLTVLAWILTVSMLVKDIVYEKEMRLKEFMKVMGLSNGIHWLAWFITSFVMMFSICVVLCVILKYGQITANSDLSVLIVFFCCFSIATITQCFLVSVFFNRANLAACVAGILYFLLYLPYTILFNYTEVLETYHKFLASLSSTVAFSYGCEIISAYESQIVGLNWNNFYNSPYNEGGLTMNYICLILLLDSFIYILLTWYWENVLPGEFGLSKPFYYPLLPSYWCPSLVKDSLEDTFDNKDHETNDECMNKSEIGIEIRNLHKIYKRDRLHALKGISVNFYSNEITSLLGHNGAGKSTLMNILTGIYEYTPMSNTRIKINGTKLNKNNINKLRHEYIGYVPQYNILFDKLTVYEHLLFYSYLKYTPLEGQSSKTRTDINRQIDELLRDTLLYKHKSKYASELSGGMKRKLSVAIAFVGNSRICILDEPSAGVDPLGRRSIWDLLFKYKSTRTIIISTHHMDEADILGDRICILSNGTIVTHGTCDDIKQEYGNGYTITLFSKHDQDTFKSDQILELIKNTIPNAYIMNDSNNKNEIKVSIGNDKTKFKDLFKILEDNQDRLSIKEHVSIQDTTLEEIFIKIAKQPELTTAPNDSFAYRMANLLLNKFKSLLKRSDECIEQPVNNLKKDVNSVDNEDDEEYRTLMNESIITNSLQLSLQQLKALLIKRFHRTKRNLKGFLAEIVLPIVFVCLALIVSILKPPIIQRPALEVHPWLYESPNHIFYSINTDLVTPEIQSINQSFYQNPSLGTKCMKNHTIKYVSYKDRPLTDPLVKELYCNRNISLIAYNKELPIELKNALLSTNYTFSKISPDCSCDKGFPTCPIGAGGDAEYKHVSLLRTQDYLYDLSNRNITDWLIKTEFQKKFIKNRYGGFEFIKEDGVGSSLATLFNTLNLSLGSNDIMNSNLVKIWYNNKGYFAHNAYLNTLNNAILRSKLKKLNASIDVEEYGIVHINHPMNYTSGDLSLQIQSQVYLDLFVAICIVFALSFIPASFLVFLLEERENNSKQLQYVSGVKPFIYWISNYTWDLMNYLVPCLLCICVFFIFNVQTYVSKENFPCLIALMLLYGWACIPLMYPLNYLFKVPSTAFVISSSINVFIGIVTTMTTTVLEQLGREDEELSKINELLKPVFIIMFPHYCLGRGFLEMSIYYNEKEAQRILGFSRTYDPFEFNKIGKNLVALSCHGIVFFVFNLLIEYKFFINTDWFWKRKDIALLYKDKDEDVVDEELRVNSDGCDDFFKLKQVRKTYRKLNGCNRMRSYEAVKGISLGLKRGDCFGLIGYNGAGKTTTFKMITGEISLTSGSIQIDNENISERKRSSIGYCPQKDAIFDLLTCREHVEYYLRIRGITRVNKRLVELILHKINLNEYSSKISKYLSGGNKRKLSTVISSLCGQTSIICLDEPTSGMDAKAKRYLWNDIKALAKSDRLIILTSHSMDECEQLCNKICIMKNGLFKCLGSPSYIKSKYGNGYKLTIQLNTIEVDTTKNEHDAHNSNHKQLIYTILNLFKESKLNDMHKKGLYEFTIKFNSIKLSQIFDLIELNRHKLNIKDYSVNETTLDQIFVDLAKDDDEFGIENGVYDGGNSESTSSDDLQLSVFTDDSERTKL